MVGVGLTQQICGFHSCQSQQPESVSKAATDGLQLQLSDRRSTTGPGSSRGGGNLLQTPSPGWEPLAEELKAIRNVKVAAGEPERHETTSPTGESRSVLETWLLLKLPPHHHAQVGGGHTAHADPGDQVRRLTAPPVLLSRLQEDADYFQHG